MSLTPQALKQFRKFFLLRQDQAAALALCTRGEWWAWEAGTAEPPASVGPRLIKAAKRIKRLAAWNARYCQYCRRNVEKALKRGRTRCPYCGKIPTPHWRQQVINALSSLPKRQTPDYQANYQAVIRRLGYNKDHFKEDKRCAKN